MSDPWLSIIGLGEDGLNGLGSASRAALDAAEVIFGGPRHLELAAAGTRGQPWPVPFSVSPVLAARGRRVVVLASGDPFWHGAGGSLAAHLAPEEWRAYPAPSTFALAAARLGWRLEEVLCLGLHAAPFARLRPLLHRGERLIVLLRDGSAPAELATWLTKQGFGASRMTVLEALGGPRERRRATVAERFALTGITAPVAVALEAEGLGLPHTPGFSEDLFAHDGQITKAPVRALTLSALAPRPGERLWDLGAGSGSISIEWALAAPGATAEAVERRADRLPHITENAERFGLTHRITATEGESLDTLPKLPRPDAVFIGGGASKPLLDALWDTIPTGTRVVINAVTLGTEALLAEAHAAQGGRLLRIELAEAKPLGRMQGWAPARPVVQWSVTR